MRYRDLTLKRIRRTHTHQIVWEVKRIKRKRNKIHDELTFYFVLIHSILHSVFLVLFLAFPQMKLTYKKEQRYFRIFIQINSAILLDAPYICISLFHLHACDSWESPRLVFPSLSLSMCWQQKNQNILCQLNTRIKWKEEKRPTHETHMIWN